MVSRFIKKSIIALRTWCDGSDGPLGCSCVELINIYVHKRLQWSGSGG